MEASAKLKAAVDYYEQKLGKNFDRRPTSGMVGQRCLGFVEDSNGNFIRIVPEMKTEDDIGPGSYNPEKPPLEIPQVNAFLKLFGKKDETLNDADKAFQYSGSRGAIGNLEETNEIMQFPELTRIDELSLSA